MRIKITNFRCIKCKEVELPDAGTVLIQGDNGVGKTTFFNAIEWCLYGKGNNINHFSDAEKGDRPQVMIATDDVTIIRHKYPDDLLVKHLGKEYFGNEGEYIIKSLYGERDIWNDCCYLAQDKLHTLCETNAADRYNLIYNLTFGHNSEDPAEVVEKLEARSKVLEGKITAGLALVDHFSKDIKRLTKHDVVYTDLSKCEDDIGEICGEINAHVEKKKEIKVKYTTYMEKTRQKQMIEDEIIILTEKLNTADGNLKILKGKNGGADINVSELERVKELFENYLKIILTMKDIEREISDIEDDAINPGIDLKPFMTKWKDFILKFNLGEDFASVEKKITLLLENNDECDKYDEKILNINEKYEKEKNEIIMHNKGIEMEINKAENNNRLVKIYDKYKQLVEENDKIKGEYPAVVENEYGDKLDKNMSEARERIFVIDKLSSSEYTCPECKTCLSIDGGNLISLGDAKDYGEERESLVRKLEQLQGDREKFMSFNNNKKSMEQMEQTYNISANSNVTYIDIKVLREGIRPIPNKPEVNKKPTRMVKNSENIGILRLLLRDLTDLRNYTPEEHDESGGRSASESSEVVKPDVLTTKPGVKLQLPHFFKLKISSVVKDIENRERRKVLLTKLERLREMGLSLESKDIIPRDEGDIRSKIKECKEYSAKFTDLQKEIVIYTDMLKQMKEKLSGIQINEEDSRLIDEISAIDKKIGECEDKLRICNHDKVILEHVQKRSDNQKIVDDLKNEIGGIDKLTKMVEKLTYESMSDVINSIQNQTNEILKCIYEDGPDLMQIELSTEKIAKNGRSKNCINLQIIHKGLCRDNLKDLSGGEINILSFALILGLSRTSNMNLLILDESFNSICTEKRSQCMEVIEQFLADKCVCFILHGTDPNLYSKVIDFY